MVSTQNDIVLQFTKFFYMFKIKKKKNPIETEGAGFVHPGEEKDERRPDCRLPVL